MELVVFLIAIVFFTGLKGRLSWKSRRHAAVHGKHLLTNPDGWSARRDLLVRLGRAWARQKSICR